MMVLNILLIKKKAKLLNRYVLSYLKGNIKYFENGGKNISFVIKDDDVLDKYKKLGTRLKRH